MEIEELIAPERVFLHAQADCAKQVFRMVADPASGMLHVSDRDILDALCERERLGTTAVGNGISIPHARLEGLNHAIAYFVRLEKAIDMDAPDDRPVDLFFILFVPDGANNEHLRILSRIARFLRADDNQIMIRDADSVDSVISLFANEAA